MGMLVLSRKVGQSITVDTGTEKIRVTLTKIDDGQVCLGFEAPAKIAVYRDELVDGREWEKRGRE